MIATIAVLAALYLAYRIGRRVGRAQGFAAAFLTLAAEEEVSE